MNAAAATQQMLDLFDIAGIVHFGISGNANNSMSIGDVTIPQQFAHTGIWDWMVKSILTTFSSFNLILVRSHLYFLIMALNSLLTESEWNCGSERCRPVRL